MQHRPGRRAGVSRPGPRRLGAALMLTMLVPLATGCAPSVMDGRAASMLYDPDRVGGLEVSDGFSGVRPDAPVPHGDVTSTDGGDVDRIALLAVNDIQDFWTATYPRYFSGPYRPVATIRSYDSTDPSSPRVCGKSRIYGDPNASYCRLDDSISWDRGALLPNARRYFGDASVAGVLAHEMGHAVQTKAHTVHTLTRTIVKEQQADCFAGVYLHWVAEGHSTRFALNTTDGLDHVIAGGITLRDPTDESQNAPGAHGSALDRVGAFQEGFDGDAATCAAIDHDEIERRHVGLPPALQSDASTESTPGEMPVNEKSLTQLMDTLAAIFHPQQAPILTLDGAGACADARPSPPASYCPATNTITVDLGGLQRIGTYADDKSRELLQGDDTAFSVVTSRYMLGMQHAKGVSLVGKRAALRTACLTGVAQRGMATPVRTEAGDNLVLNAGDLDEAVSGLLTNRLVASDVNGDSVPAGFTRIVAFRSGLVGDAAQCYGNFS